MDWTPHADRINSLLVRSERIHPDMAAAALANLVVIFGLTDEEHFQLDLHGMSDEMEEVFLRVINEMRAAGIDVD